MKHTLRKCLRLLKPHCLLIVSLGLFPVGIIYLLSQLDTAERQRFTPLFLLPLVGLGCLLLGSFAQSFAQSLTQPRPPKNVVILLVLLFLTGATIILSIAGCRLAFLAFQLNS